MAPSRSSIRRLDDASTCEPWSRFYTSQATPWPPGSVVVAGNIVRKQRSLRWKALNSGTSERSDGTEQRLGAR